MHLLSIFEQYPELRPGDTRSVLVTKETDAGGGQPAGAESAPTAKQLVFATRRRNGSGNPLPSFLSPFQFKGVSPVGTGVLAASRFLPGPASGRAFAYAAARWLTV